MTKLVAAQAQEVFAGGENRLCALLHGLQHVPAFSGRDFDIASVDDAQPFQGVEGPGPAAGFPAQVSGSLADALRAVTCACAPGGAQVVGYAEDDDIGLRIRRVRVDRQAEVAEVVTDQTGEGGRVARHYFITGMVNSAAWRMPVGQRAVIVFMRV